MSELPAHALFCRCCSPLPSARVGRRLFLGLVSAAGAAGLMPGLVRAASGQYEVLLLTCIDPRFPEHTIAYMRSRNLAGKYSQVSLAGASVAVVAPAFKDWRPAFWENLGASIQLHQVPKVMVLNHRACGAAEIAFGKDAVANREMETRTHRAAFTDFRSQVASRHPFLIVETGLMGLDGTVEMFTS